VIDFQGVKKFVDKNKPLINAVGGIVKALGKRSADIRVKRETGEDVTDNDIFASCLEGILSVDEQQLYNALYDEADGQYNKH
jgi:hypothetical protein